jgi:hypothetical protein
VEPHPPPIYRIDVTWYRLNNNNKFLVIKDSVVRKPRRVENGACCWVLAWDFWRWTLLFKIVVSLNVLLNVFSFPLIKGKLQS